MICTLGTLHPRRKTNGQASLANQLSKHSRRRNPQKPDRAIATMNKRVNGAGLVQVKNDKDMDNILKSLEEFNGLLTDKSKPEKHQVALTSKVNFAFLHTSLQRNVSLLISAVTEWALPTPRKTPIAVKSP
jgi:hypothetical protein